MSSIPIMVLIFSELGKKGDEYEQHKRTLSTSGLILR